MPFFHNNVVELCLHINRYKYSGREVKGILKDLFTRFIYIIDYNQKLNSSGFH